MAADVQIRFKSDSTQAQRDIDALQKEIADLRASLGQSERAADTAGKGMQQLGQQSRQTAASLDALEKQSNAVRRETLDYRTALTKLNNELADNRKALLSADAAGKETLETRNKQIRAEQGLLRARQQSSALTLSALQQERRELGSLSGAFRDSEKSGGLLTKTVGHLGFAVGAVGVGVLAKEVFDFGGASLKAAGEMEGMVRGLEDAYGSTELATQRFSEFVELAKDPGLGIQQLTTYDAIFKNIGGTASENNVIFTGLAKGITTYGGSIHDVTGALHQLQQAMGGNRIVAQDFRPILERTRGTFLTTAQQVHGFTGGIDEMRQAWQASGQSLKQFLLPIFERMSERFAGAPVDAFTNKIGNLEDAFGLLQAEIGKKLLPVFNPFADGLLNTIENLTDFIAGTDAATESVERFTTSLIAADDASGRDDAIQNRIRFLREYITELKEAERNRGIFDTRGRVSDRAESSSAQTQLTRLQRIEAGDPQIIKEIQTEISKLNAEFERLHDQQVQRGEYILSLDERRRASARRRSEAFLESVGEEEDAIVAQIELREIELQAAEEAAAGVVKAEQEKEVATRRAAEESKAAVQATLTSAEALVRLQAASEDAQSALSDVIDAQQVSSSLQTATQAVDAYYNAQITNARVARTAAAEDSKEREELDVRLFELGRQHTQARLALVRRAADVENDLLEKQGEAVQRQSDARIESARLAREVEVAGFEAAAKSGQQYAEELRQLAFVSQRRAFVELVDRLQEQGLSFDEARARAAEYFRAIIRQEANRIQAAETARKIEVAGFEAAAAKGQEYAEQLSQLVDADARRGFVEIVDRLQEQGLSFDEARKFAERYIETLNRASERDLDGSLERSLLNEQQYFQQNQDGLTLDDIQQQAGQDGRTGLLNLFGQGFGDVERVFGLDFAQHVRQIQATGVSFRDALFQARDYFNELHRQTDANEIFQQTVGIIGSIGNDLERVGGDTGETINQVIRTGTDLVRIASGDFTALANIAGDVISFIADREEELHRRREERARERIAFEQEAADRIRSFSDLQQIFGGQPDQFITPSERRFSPGQRADELSALGIQAPITTLPDFDLQGFIDSINIEPLSGVQVQGLVSEIFINQASIQEAFQPFIDEFRRTMTFAGDDFRAAIERGLSDADITTNFNDYLSAINDFYDLRIEEEEAAGRLTFGLAQELNRLRADALNDARLLYAQPAEYSVGGSSVTVSTPEDRAAQAQVQSYFDDPDFQPAEVATGVSEALQTTIANRIANEALDALREAASDANVTTQQIIDLWESARPDIEAWYQELLEDTQSIKNDAERTEAIAALGSQQDFVSRLKSQYVTPVLTGIQRGQEALQTRTANRIADEALGAIRTAAEDANVTETKITELWMAALPLIETWYQELLEDAQAIENEGERSEAIADLGTPEQFTANLKSQYVTHVITGIQRSAEALQARTASRLAQTALDAIRTAAADANVTEEEITRLWTTALPLIENWYQELLEDARSIENHAERSEAIADLGTPEQFTANLKSQYVTPVITGIQRSAEALETRTANRLANEALQGIREAAEDANVTEAEITKLWTEALPLLETWYQELLDDAQSIENDAERTEAVAALGTSQQFLANLKSQYVTPVITGIQRSQGALKTRTANRLAQEALEGIREATQDANITEEQIATLWTAALPLLEAWYQELLDDAQSIENDAERTEAIAALGTSQQFLANLKSQYVAPVIADIRRSAEALETRTATRLAQEALDAISEAARDANVTETEISNLWDASIPALKIWYQELLDDANAIENDAERTEAIADLGTSEQFLATLKSQYVTPLVTGIRSTAEVLETRTANRLANEALEGIREASEDANATEEQIATLWTTALPLLNNWYQELLDDAKAIENDAERTEAIAALGSPEQFIANLKSQYVTPVITGIQRSAEALETRTANRLANEALGGIREAATDANVTEAEIAALWTAALPHIENWYNELLDDAKAIENEGDQNEAINALGSTEAFIANLKSQYVSPVLTSIAQSKEALETRTANRLAQEVLGGLREAAEDANVTEVEIATLWTAALPLLNNWYQELLDDAKAIENDAERAEAIAALGTPQQFVANLKSQYVSPVITGIQRAAEALETRTTNRLAQTALGGIREASQDANVTEQQILDLWTAALPLIQSWYQELLDDANAIENDAERTEAIAALGSPEAFIANLKAQYVTPVITGIQKSREALQTRTAIRLAQTALQGLREAAEDANVTEQQILELWATALPLIENWYQELLEDARSIENDAERTEAIAALGTPEQFIANLKAQYVTPLITGIQRAAEALETQTANRLANEALGGLRSAAEDVNITEAEITRLWAAALPLIQDWYQELLDDANTIKNDAERTEAIAALGSPEAFVANLKSQYVTPVLNGITQSTEALQTRTANRQAQTAIQALRDVADDVNLTEKAIRDKWQEAIPFLRTWWQELYDDIVNNANLSDAEVAEALAELGSVEAFVGNIRSQYVTPVLNRIFQTQFRSRSNLAQNRLNRAQFNLGGATSESDFETRRQAVIQAINDYYDAEEERINNLEVSEAELRDLREDNQLARQQALRSAETATNQFAEERIRTEERIQSEIQDLRDDAVENEADRLERIADLQERHNEKILELEVKLQEDILGLRRDRAESAADIETEFQRDLEDLRTKIARDLFGEDVISFGDLTESQQSEVQDSTDFQRRLFDHERDRDREIQDLNTEFGVLRQESTAAFDYYRQALQRGELSEQDILSVFGRRGLDQYTRFEQTTTNANEDLTADIASVNAEAEATSKAISEALAPLIEKSETTATTEAETAAVTATTAKTESETGEKNAKTAAAQAALVMLQESAMETWQSSAARFNESVVNLDTAIDKFALIPQSFDNVVTAFRELPQELLKKIESSIFEPAVRLPGPRSVEQSEKAVKSAQEAFAEPRTPTHFESLAITAKTVHLSGDIVGSGGIQDVRVINDVRIINTDEITGGGNVGNVTVLIQLDDGSLTEIEGRMVTRADQGISPLSPRIGAQ